MTLTKRAFALACLLGSLILLSFLSLAAIDERLPFPSYVGSDSCVQCHEDTSKAWQSSHHAWAWNEPTSKTVLGNFDAQSLAHDGQRSDFTQEGASYFVETEGPEGSRERYKVLGTVGITPLQQYLVETEPGRIQALDASWDTESRRWFDLYPDQDLAPTDGLHWSGPYKNWNARCAECHATGFEKNFDPATRTYASTQAETGVGCEACHGPAEAHLRWAKVGPEFQKAAWDSVDDLGFTFAFQQNNGDRGATIEIEQCAGCHARREPIGASSPVPGTLFADSYRLALLRDGLYHADGQILDEVYVYGSFLQSKMYANGVRCTDCHDPHSNDLVADGNAVCTRCHNLVSGEEFPGLPLADFGEPAHSFHEAGTEGAECVSCHMPARTYMQVDGRRDHSFRIPRPDLSIALGTPDACTDCHSNRTAAWANEFLATRFPDSAHREPRFATVFARARSGDISSAVQSELTGLAMSDDQPSIVRATALSLLERTPSRQIADATQSLLTNSDPLIRASAISTQRPIDATTRLERILPLINDPARSVRIAAARASLDLQANHLSGTTALALDSAMREFQNSMLSKADYPEGQMVLAGTSLVLRNFRAAEAAFQEAVRLDPQLVDAWLMIARIRAANGNIEGAAEALRAGMAANPDTRQLAASLAEVEALEDL